MTDCHTWIVETSLPVSYLIQIENDLFNPENSSLLEYGSKGSGARRLVVIDERVGELYFKKISNYFSQNDIRAHYVFIDAVETKKNLDTLLTILKEAEQFNVMRRDEPIIAIGGGVLLDVAGMAANLYRRGVPYIKVPTTLLAIVDASVGVKTGINFETRRNRLGTYYPPVAAYLDKSFVETLEDIEISSALGEILKMAVSKDSVLFQILENDGRELYSTKFLNVESADEVIARSVQGMKEELENNLWEHDLERVVDFGHSFSPVIEMRSLEDDDVADLTHGQAVTLDVIFSSVISFNRDMLDLESLNRIFQTAREMKLPTGHPFFFDASMLLESLNDTMKHRNGNQNLPVPVQIGSSVFLNDVSYDEIKKAAKYMSEINE